MLKGILVLSIFEKNPFHVVKFCVVTRKFDYTAVADRLRTVSWSNYGHPTGVFNLVYGPNLPTPRNSRVIKRTHV